jgi:hypothetical protein
VRDVPYRTDPWAVARDRRGRRLLEAAGRARGLALPFRKTDPKRAHAGASNRRWRVAAQGEGRGGADERASRRRRVGPHALRREGLWGPSAPNRVRPGREQR